MVERLEQQTIRNTVSDDSDEEETSSVLNLTKLNYSDMTNITEKLSSLNADSNEDEISVWRPGQDDAPTESQARMTPLLLNPSLEIEILIFVIAVNIILHLISVTLTLMQMLQVPLLLP